MNIRTILFVSLIGISGTSLSQTKRIAFKSHSGRDENFKKSLNLALFESENSNFGMAPQWRVVNAHLDTVIFLNDSTVELVTSHHMYYSDNYLERNEQKNLWEPGHEKIVNHPVFNSEKSIDEMKEIIQKTYNFKNDISKVVFIGEPKCEKLKKQPIKIKKNKSKTVINGFLKKGNNWYLSIFVFGLISFISIVLKPKNSKK